MADLIEIGFKVDTRNLNRARDVIGDFGTRSQNSIDNTNRAMRRLQQTIGALAASFVVFGTLDTIRTLNEYVDTYTNLNSQIRLVTNSQQELNATYRELRDISQDTLTGLEATTRLYSNLIRSTKDLGLSQDQVAQLTRTTNQLFLISGATAKETSAALRQLTQGLAAGALRGDEFNSVAENAPRIMDLLAEKLQMNRGELREFAATGGITAEIFANAILDSADATDKLAQHVEVTFEKKLQVAKDNMMDFVGTHETLNSINKSLGDSILFLSENLGALEVALGAAAAAMLIRFVPAMYAGLIAVGALSGSVSIFITQLAAMVAPFIPLIAVITAAGAAFLVYKNATQEATLAMEQQRTELGHFKNAYAELNDEDLFKVYQSNLARNIQLTEELQAAEARRDNSPNVIAYNEELALIEDLNEQLDHNRAKLNLVGEEARKRNAVVKNLYTEELKLIEVWEKEQKLLDDQAEAMRKLVNSVDPYARQVSDIETKQAKLNDAFAFGGMSIVEYNRLSKILANELQTVQDEIDGTTERQKQFNEAIQVWLEKQEAIKLARLEMQEATQRATNDLHLEKLAAEAAAEGTDAARIAVQLLAFEQQLWASGVNPAMIAGLVQQKKEILELEAVTKTSAKSSKDLNSLLKDISTGADRIGSAFTNTGNGIIDTFGEALSVLTEFSNRMDTINFQRQELLDLQAKGNLSAEEEMKIKKGLADLDEQSLSANLSGISSVLGASKTLFKEQSKEREALHRLEMGFLVAEMALGAQKAITNAIAAITNQGGGDPYTAFARIAAMTAIMAGIVGAIGATISGGGSAPTFEPATGTVLGDPNAQSESITNSVELFGDVQIDQLAELRGIRDSINNLSGAINQLTRDIVGTGGLDLDFVEGLGVDQNLSGAVKFFEEFTIIGAVDKLLGGLMSGLLKSFFGSVTRTVENSGITILEQSFESIIQSGNVLAETFAVVKTKSRSLFGLVSNTDFDTVTNPLDNSITSQLGLIFGFMADSLLQAGELLDVSIKTFANGAQTSLEESLRYFVLPELDIAFDGKTGEEIEEELNAMVGLVGDQLAEFLFPQLQQYQQLNEGMFETVLRVTKETVAFEDALEKLGGDLGSSTIALVDFGQTVIEMLGGLDAFNSAISGFIDNFYSESEQLGLLTNDLQEVFQTLGLEMPNTAEGFRRLVEETIAMGSAGAETLAVLLQISDAFADMIDLMENVAEETRNTSGRLIELATFFNAIRTNSSTEFFQNLRLTADAYTALTEAFGSAANVSAAVQSLANNFAGSAIQMDVAQEALAASMSGIFSALGSVNGINSRQTDAAELFNDLRVQIRRNSTTPEEIETMMLNIINELEAVDFESGLFEELLRIEGPMAAYVDALRQQAEAAAAAAEAEAQLQAERDNRTLDLQIELLRTQGSELEAVALERAREIEILQEYDEQNQTNLANIQALIYLQEDYNSALEQQQAILSEALDNVRNAVQAEINTIQQMVLDLETLGTRLSGGIRRTQVNMFGSFEIAEMELRDALQAAREGNFDPASNLDINTLTSGNTDSFSTRAEFNLAQARVAAALKEIQELSADQLSEHEIEIGRLDSILENVENQYNTLLGIEENQIQQLIDNGQYAEALDLALAEFINEAVSTNGLLALQDETMVENFQNLIDLQQELIASGDLNADTFLSVAENGNGLLSQLQDALGVTRDDLVGALDSTTDGILSLADIQQALIDANLVNFESLIELTDEQRQQIIDHLNSLTDVTANLDVDMVAQLNTANLTLLGMTGTLLKMVDWLETINQTTLEIADKGILAEIVNVNKNIKALNKTTLEIADKGILSELVKANENLVALDSTTLAIADKGILNELIKLNEKFDPVVIESGGNEAANNNDLLVALDKINQTTLAIVDKGILAQLMKIDDTILAIADKGILQAIKDLDATTLAIADKGILAAIEKSNRYLKDISENLSGSTGSSTSDALILGQIRDNTAAFTSTLINDNRRKVSLPSSHYNNQSSMVSELKGIKSKLKELTNNNWYQNKAIEKSSKTSAEVLQRIEINGLDTRTE